MPSDRTLSRLHSGDYKFIVDEKSLLRFREVAQRVIKDFKLQNPPGKTLLDVGAGYGTFVEVALSNGLNAIGIEPAKNLHVFARSKLGDKVQHTDLRNFIRTNRATYDFISLIHVIEHVKDPKSFLIAVLKLLKPNGVLYMETPNGSSHQAVVEKDNYTFLTPPDHLNLFSQTSLQELIESFSGISSCTCRTYSYPEHLVGILRTIKKRILNTKSISDDHNIGTPIVDKKKDDAPFFDRVVAPVLTPLLNIKNRGSFLQAFIQKKI